MTRTGNDTWDLASSVSATATMVAAARAVVSAGDDPLITDPFAEPLARAVGDHRTQHPRQRSGRRERADHRRGRSREGGPADAGGLRAGVQTWIDLDFANLVYLGGRNEAAGYLADHGWKLTRRNVNELQEANGLAPIEDDEEVGNFGELQYVNGILCT
jgi:O-methyltransferase involved in polyketide biosynthesis